MKTKFFKKALSVFTAMAMALSLMTGIPFSELGLGITVSAETTTYDVNAKTIAGLGTGVIVDPTAPTNDNDAWKGSYVYYGNYDGSPVKYRVLDASTTDFSADGTTKTMLLDCDSILYYQKFDNDGTANEDNKKANDWSISDIKSSLNGDDFLNKEGVFTTAEKNAIAASTVDTHTLTTDNVADWMKSRFVNYVALTGEQIFLLDAEDVSNGAYGYSMTDESCGNRKKIGSSAAYWWLRSAYRSDGIYAGFVSDDGNIYINYVHGDSPGVSPALNLNLSSVLFSSANAVSKSSALTSGSTEIGTEANTDWKLTLKDTGKSVALAEGRSVTKASDGTITVPYTYTDKENATDSEKVNQISVMITDKAYDAEKAANAQEAQILYYGALQDIKNAEGTSSTVAEASTGTGTFALPSGLTGTLGTDYHIYLLAEHVNVDNSTDYASEPVKVEKIYLDISEATALQNGTLTYDGTAQTPTFTVTLGNTTLTADDYDVTVTAQTNAGNYTATITGKGNYRGTISSVTWSIGKATPSVTAPTAKTGLVYKGTAQELILAGSTDFGTLLYSLDDTIYSEDIPTGTDAGSYTVYYKVQGNDSVSDIAAEPITATIGKAAVTVTANSYTIKVGEALPTYAYDVAGLVNGETLPIDVTISCNAADSNTAGTYDIIVSGAAASDNYTFSYVKGTLTVSEKEIVAAPTFTPASGTTFTSSQKVTISCATAGAKIYYTTDGTEPTTASTLYNGAFTITTTTTIKAIAVKDGMTDSTVVTATYTKKSSGGGGGGGGYTPSRPSTPNNPEIGGSAKSWSDVAADLGKLANGSEATIELNGNTTVPVEVIQVIADRDLKVTFVYDSVKNWKTDGAEITTPAAADLSIIATSKLKTDVLRGISGYQFSTNNTNIPTDLEIAFKTEHAGKFANLYKSVDGKLVFVTCAKLGEDGKVILPDVVDKGEYVVMLCEFSDRLGDMDNDGVMNAKDAAAILKDIVEIEPGKNPLMADFNGDGRINAMDAAAILKRIVGLE